MEHFVPVNVIIAERIAFLRFGALNCGPRYPLCLFRGFRSCTRVKACKSTRRLARFLLRRGQALGVVTQLYGGMEYRVHFSARCAAFAVQVTTAVRISCLVSCFSFLCNAASGCVSRPELPRCVAPAIILVVALDTRCGSFQWRKEGD